MLKSTGLLPSPNICWVVDLRITYLVDNHEERSLILQHPEAALWDLLCRKRWQTMVPILSVLTDQDPAATSHWIETTCSRWLEQGWLRLGL